MTDRDALLRAILLAPGDDTPRLAFADWLDEHGEPGRAELRTSLFVNGVASAAVKSVRAERVLVTPAGPDHHAPFGGGHVMADANSTVTYRAIPDAVGYRVGDDGSVWSCLQRVYAGGEGRGVSYQPCGEWLRLTPSVVAGGYSGVDIHGEHRLVHRLVLEGFVGPRPQGMGAAHNNGNPADNRLSNLRWATPASNQADRVHHATHSRGERHGQHKLTGQDIRDITRLADSGFSRAAIGRQFGIHPSTVRRIAKGLAWKHINPRSESYSFAPSASDPGTIPQG